MLDGNKFFYNMFVASQEDTLIRDPIEKTVKKFGDLVSSYSVL